MMDNDEMVEDLECRITETKEDIQVIIYLIVRVGGGGGLECQIMETKQDIQ